MPIIFLILLFNISTSFSKPSIILNHISERNSVEAFNLSTHWAQGNVVALIRHAERCDHSDNPCLDGVTGITSIGMDTAIEVGENFEQFLPSADAIIFNSPLKRTSQTAQLMFSGKSTSQNWLHENCKERFLEDILKHKPDRVNMVLVTHSTCINNLRSLDHKKLIPINSGEDKNYALTVFLTISKESEVAFVLGYVNANDWENLSHKKAVMASYNSKSNKRSI
jgi:phosphohistidine phosphatase SixA